MWKVCLSSHSLMVWFWCVFEEKRDGAPELPGTPMIQEGLTSDRSDECSGIVYAKRMLYAHDVDLSVVFYDSDALSFDESTADEVT